MKKNFKVMVYQHALLVMVSFLKTERLLLLEVVVRQRSNLLLQKIDIRDDRLVALQLAGIGITQQELEHGDGGYRINSSSLPMTSLPKTNK